MLGWWNLDGNANDSVNGYNGDFSSVTAASDRFGNANSAAKMSGGAYLDLGKKSAFDFDGSKSFSITTWIAPNKPPCWDNPLVTKYGYLANEGFMFSQTDYDQSTLLLAMGGNKCRAQAFVDQLMPYGEWSHVAAS